MDARAPKNDATRPDIFRYHDYREFLRDWFNFLKQTKPGFSLRSLARESGLASGYLPMVLSGSRNLSAKALEKCSRYLALTPRERNYLDLLRTLGDSDAPEARREAFEKIQRYRTYQQVNPREIEVYRYLTRWFYVAIREMALLPGFRPDARWIQARLKGKVSLKEVQQALDFLISNGFMTVQPDGTVKVPQKDMQCIGGVFKLALGNFHSEMLGLAIEAISNTPRDKRSVTGHTMAVSEKNYDKMVKILEGALKQIADLEETDDSANDVYHVALAAFPLSLKGAAPADPETPSSGVSEPAPAAPVSAAEQDLGDESDGGEEGDEF